MQCFFSSLSHSVLTTHDTRARLLGFSALVFPTRKPFRILLFYFCQASFPDWNGNSIIVAPSFVVLQQCNSGRSWFVFLQTRRTLKPLYWCNNYRHSKKGHGDQRIFWEKINYVFTLKKGIKRLLRAMGQSNSSPWQDYWTKSNGQPHSKAIPQRMVTWSVVLDVIIKDGGRDLSQPIRYQIGVTQYTVESCYSGSCKSLKNGLARKLEKMHVLSPAHGMK